jgi:hypothetical protein
VAGEEEPWIPIELKFWQSSEDGVDRNCVFAMGRSLSLRWIGFLSYLTNLNRSTLILWCYFLWYLIVVMRYFDPSPTLWLTSIGLSVIVGLALLVSTSVAGTKPVHLDRWQTIRLFLMPFCVSSFSALVRGKGFILIFSPRVGELIAALLSCAALWLIVSTLKRLRGSERDSVGS